MFSVLTSSQQTLYEPLLNHFYMFDEHFVDQWLVLVHINSVPRIDFSYIVLNEYILFGGKRMKEATVTHDWHTKTPNPNFV